MHAPTQGPGTVVHTHSQAHTHAHTRPSLFFPQPFLSFFPSLALDLTRNVGYSEGEVDSRTRVSRSAAGPGAQGRRQSLAFQHSARIGCAGPISGSPGSRYTAFVATVTSLSNSSRTYHAIFFSYYYTVLECHVSIVKSTSAATTAKHGRRYQRR